jgi:hypothetical protein
MNHPHPTIGRRGKALAAAALVAATLSIGGAITATAATDLHNEPTQAQAGFHDAGDHISFRFPQ